MLGVTIMTSSIQW